MNSGRVIFQKKAEKVVEGRREDSWVDYYKAWATFPGLSMQEQTDANNRKLTDAITMEVRTCQKTEELRKDMKHYRAIHKGMIYDLKGADYSRKHEGFIRLLASRTD